MHRTKLRLLAAPLLAGLALLVASCGTADNVPQARADTGATLEGTVKVGNEQIHYALVTVRSAGGSSSAKLDEEGKYKLTNVPLGEVQVGVNTSAAMGEYQADKMKAGAMTGGGDAGGKTGRKKVNLQMIHLKEQYFDPEKSGLKTTVNAGANTFNIELPASAKK